MTQFLCEKHGMQSGIFTSPYVAQKMLKGEKFLESSLEVLVLDLLTEIPGKYRVDNAFIAENENLILARTEESEWELECRLQPICAACYREHIISDTKSS